MANPGWLGGEKHGINSDRCGLSFEVIEVYPAWDIPIAEVGP
jgi:hypothetical protein